MLRFARTRDGQYSEIYEKGEKALGAAYDDGDGTVSLGLTIIPADPAEALVMQEDPNLRITVEGHTCNIGTTEYNLALGERRSAAVRDYLVGRGINASRLQTVSYGEERPKHDNSREETRRLNRRAAMTIRLQ